MQNNSELHYYYIINDITSNRYRGTLLIAYIIEYEYKCKLHWHLIFPPRCSFGHALYFYHYCTSILKQAGIQSVPGLSSKIRTPLHS